MSSRAASVFGWSVLVAGAVLVGVGLGLTARSGARGEDGLFVMSTVSTIAMTCAVVGALIVPREPRNPIGWLFVGFAAFVALSVLVNGYGVTADATAGGGRWAGWVSLWAYVALLPLAIFVPLLFPDGQLLSPGWRLVGWMGGVGTAVFLVGVAGNPGSIGGAFGDATNPLPLAADAARALRLAGVILVVGAFLAAAASIAVRYRTSGELRRQQIKLLAAAAVLTAACVVAGEVLRALGAAAARDVLSVLGVLAIPVAIAVAMLRYRLYDVDRLISRSLTYAVVTSVLAAAYVGLVIGGQALFSSFAGGSNLAIAASTLVVAGLFLPLRSRVQAVVDRRFYRRRYDARRTLDSFASGLRRQVELESLTDELRHVIGETMQPVHLSVWLRADDPLAEPRSASPRSDSRLR